ncbi:MAG: hypothetical protein AAF798_04705 [Bacteroidota bacterium]
MKSPILITVFAFLSYSLMGQASFTKGVLTYKVTEVDAEDYRLNMLNGLEVDIHFTPQRQLTTMSALFGMVSQKVLIQKMEQTVDLFSSMMGRNYHVQFTPEDQQKKEDVKSSIQYFPKETKQIAGYTTYKAIVTNTKGDKVRTYELYITEDLVLDVEVMRDVDGLEDLKGLPLQYTINNPKLKLTFSATAVQQKIDLSVFDFDQTGYETISPKEMKEKKIFGF